MSISSDFLLLIFLVHTSASDCLGTVSKITYNVSSGMLNLTHLLTDIRGKDKGKTMDTDGRRVDRK